MSYSYHTYRGHSKTMVCPTQKLWNKLHIHTYKLYTCIWAQTYLKVYLNLTPGRSLSPASASPPSYGWPPGRGRSGNEVGTSKLRLFAKVGLRMGLAITSAWSNTELWLGGWTNPSEKYESKWVHLPLSRGENEKMFETICPHLSNCITRAKRAWMFETTT